MSQVQREQSVVNGIQKYLKSLPECWFFKVHGSPVQKVGVPDIVGVLRGRFFAIEVKRPGEDPTPIQVAVMAAMKRAGGVVGVARSTEDARAILDGV